MHILLTERRGAMSFDQKVRELRENRGMNRKELAEEAKLTQATISRIENGLVKQLKSDALKRLADALRVTVDYLVGKTDRLTPSDVVDSDPQALAIFRGYEKLSDEGREDVANFVRFLQKKEKK